MTDRRESILVIKLGALGDVVLATAAFRAIRAHHETARITLLTTRPYAAFLGASPYFDEVWCDARPKLWNLPAVAVLRARLRAGRFDRVYDLQTSDRTGWYFRLMGPGRRPAWSGNVAACAFPHCGPARETMHTVERQRAQLALAGVAATGLPDLSWVAGDDARFAAFRDAVLLVPGGAAHRPEKRWPVGHYTAIAHRLLAAGRTPVVLGGAGEASLARDILAAAPGTRDLTGKTGLADLAVLARVASAALGNDTGPMHVIAASGCPSVVLFSGASDPALCAPRGPAVRVLRRAPLADLAVAEVGSVLDSLPARRAEPVPSAPSAPSA